MAVVKWLTKPESAWLVCSKFVITLLLIICGDHITHQNSASKVLKKPSLEGFV
jgi:hypothetical protein